jgi:retron-type reverse transcriptase
MEKMTGIRFLRLIIPSILPCVTHMFNTVLTCSIFSEDWKMSKILPVPKIPKPGELGDYRPISMLPALSKTLEVVMYDQMMRFVDENRLLGPYQSGFSSGHSTATTLLKITSDIQRDCDQRLVTLLLLLDFSKAFDNVRHSLLLKKISLYFKFGGTAVALVGSYLSDRFQCASVGGMHSELIAVIKGVVQGSVMGPLLFSIIINDIDAQIDFCRFHMYANDVQLYLSDDPCSLDECIRRMNADLDRLYIWGR